MHANEISILSVETTYRLGLIESTIIPETISFAWIFMRCRPERFNDTRPLSRHQPTRTQREDHANLLYRDNAPSTKLPCISYSRRMTTRPHTFALHVPSSYVSNISDLAVPRFARVSLYQQSRHATPAPEPSRRSTSDPKPPPRTTNHCFARSTANSSSVRGMPRPPPFPSLLAHSRAPHRTHPDTTFPIANLIARQHLGNY